MALQAPARRKGHNMTVTTHTAEGVTQIHMTCRLASEVLDRITPFVVPGMMASKLDQLRHIYVCNV